MIPPRIHTVASGEVRIARQSPRKGPPTVGDPRLAISSSFEVFRQLCRNNLETLFYIGYSSPCALMGMSYLSTPGYERVWCVNWSYLSILQTTNIPQSLQGHQTSRLR